MKHPIARCLQGALCACLCFVILFGALVPAVAETTDPLDFGIADRENNTVLSAEELYRLLIGRAPTEAEQKYLLGMELSMTYNDVIPDDRISTAYHAETGTLELSVLPYSYQAKSGETVTWIPTHATIGGVTLPLSKGEGGYTCTFRELFYSDDFEATVDYIWTVTIPSETVELLQNAAWRAGSAALETDREHAAALKEYSAILDAHRAWCDYLDWVDERAAYLKEKQIYDGKMADYTAYKEKYDLYAPVKDAYDQWVAYYASVDFYENHFEEWVAYREMKGRMDTIMARMAIMETIYTTESHGWQMYASIMGSTVSSVLARKDELVILQVNEEDIDLAGVATENLRRLLSGYDALRKASYPNEYEKNLALFRYYQANYIALRDNFKDLYRTLNSFYEPILIVFKLPGYAEKHPHYQQFVAQLYVISTYLDDNGGRNPDWSIGKKGLAELVETPLLLSDSDNADLSDVTFPSYVPEIEFQPLLTEPTVEKPDREPNAPTPVVEHPGEPPAFVAEPTEEDKPPEVAHPGDPPAAPVYDSVTAALMQEIRDGKLTEKPKATADVLLTLRQSVHRAVSIRNLKTVTFYDHNGMLLHRETVHFGDAVSRPVPERAEDPAYHYRALGWVTADGSEPDLTSVTGDLSLYPLYDRVAKTYTVTWILDGISYSGGWLYGSIPTPPMSLTREEGQYHRYEFSGWDREVTPVEGDITYQGSFVQIPKEYTVTWVTKNGTVTETERLPYGAMPSYAGDPQMPTDACRHEFLGWDKTLVTVSGDVTYTALYRNTPLAIDGEGKIAELLFSDTAVTVKAAEASVDLREAAKFALETGRRLVLSWEKGINLTFEGEALSRFSESGCRRTVLTQSAEAGGERLAVSFLSGGGRALSPEGWGIRLSVNPEISDLRFFEMSGDAWATLPSEGLLLGDTTQISCKTVHAITADPNSLCNLYALSPNAVAGERISLRLTCSFGYAIMSAEVVTEDGTPVSVDEELSFLMPDAPVHVTLTVEKIVYRVTFLVDGKVWSYAEYGLGEEILLPEPPTRASDDTYIYTFSEWAGLPTVAAGKQYDIVCEASFSRSYKNIDYDTGHNNNLFMELTLPLVLVGLVLLIGLIVFWRIYRRRKRARLSKAAEEATVTPETSEPPRAEELSSEADQEET